MTIADNLGSSKARDCVCVLLVVCVSLSCAASESAKGSDATVFHLNLASRSITQRVEPDDVAGARFVQVEVTEVANRRKIPLSFEVRYQAKDDTRIYLGSFALYPPDNPGKFIVATQGKVKGDGAIVLTLVISEKVDAADVVDVGIKRIRLVQS
jgi:hypothetical protein